MPALAAGIHVLLPSAGTKTWMAGTKPGHDVERLLDTARIYFAFEPVVFLARSTNWLV
jgi:hypothetical protein